MDTCVSRVRARCLCSCRATNLTIDQFRVLLWREYVNPFVERLLLSRELQTPRPTVSSCPFILGMHSSPVHLSLLTLSFRWRRLVLRPGMDEGETQCGNCWRPRSWPGGSACSAHPWLVRRPRAVLRSAARRKLLVRLSSKRTGGLAAAGDIAGGVIGGGGAVGGASRTPTSEMDEPGCARAPAVGFFFA